MLLDGASHLLLADFGTGCLYRIKLADRSVEKLADGLGAPDGLAWDQFGRLFVSDWKGGRVFVIGRPGAKSVLLAQGLTNAADVTVESSTKRLLVPDMGGGKIVAVTIKVPASEVNENPLPLQTAVAFPDLKWTGWQGETETGRINTLRPVVLTHAGDGSNRVFVATQHGVIHVFPNEQTATRTTGGALDIRGPRGVQRRHRRRRLSGTDVPSSLQGKRIFLYLSHVEIGNGFDEHRYAVPGPQG